jgi:hypothetical protein
MKVFLRDSWPLALLVLSIAFMLWQFPHRAIVFAPKTATQQLSKKPFASFVTLSRKESGALLRKAGVSWNVKTGIRFSSAMASDAGPALSDPLPQKEYMALPSNFGAYGEIAETELPKIENRLLPRSLASPEIKPPSVTEKSPDPFIEKIRGELKTTPKILEENFNKIKGVNHDDRTRGIESFYGN